MARSFVVLYYGNSGSSWLIQTLGSSRDVMVPGFEPLESWAWDAPDEEKLDWVRTAFTPPEERSGPVFDAWVESLRRSPQVTEVPPGDWDTVGFKASGFAVRDRSALVDLLAELGTKAIVLQRENRVKHALSLYRYHEEDKSQFELKGVRPPTKVKLRTFDRWLQESFRLHEGSEELRRLAEDRLGPERVTRVLYEEFVTPDGKREVMDRLAAFLGIDRASMAESGFQKATPDDLRAALVNHDRVRRRYRRRPEVARFFD